MRAYVCVYLDKANQNVLLISLQVCLARNGCPFVRARQTFFSQPHISLPCRVVPCRAAPHRAEPHQSHATPCRCRADLSSRVHVPAHPHGSVRSSGSVLIGGWQSGQADRFSLTASLSVSHSLSRPPARHPTVSFPISARPPPRLPFLLSHPSPFFGLSSSPLKHTFHVFPLPHVSVPFSLSLTVPPSSVPSFTTIVPSSPRSSMETHSSSSRRSSPFTLTTTLVVGSHPSVPRAPRREKIFMPMYRFAVPITPRNPRVRSVFLLPA